MASAVAAKADLVEEILTWLPPKSVLRFRSVCRRWRDLSSTTFFVATHTRRNPHKVVGFLLVDRSYNGTSHDDECLASYPLDKSVRRVFPDQSRALDGRPQIRWMLCRNGLALFASKCHPRLWVYNPTTRQRRILPEIQYARSNYVVLAFEPSRSPHYRVIIASSDSHEIKVYSSETDTSESFSVQQAPWINHPNPWRWLTCFCNGVMYWLDEHEGSLVSLNIEQRSVSGTLAPPPPMFERYLPITLQESRGRLLLLRKSWFFPDVVEPELQVLEMTSDHSRWLLLHTVSMKDMLLYKKISDRTFFMILNYQCWLIEGEGDDLLVACRLDSKVLAYDLTRRRRYDLLTHEETTQSIFCPCSNTLAPP